MFFFSFTVVSQRLTHHTCVTFHRVPERRCPDTNVSAQLGPLYRPISVLGLGRRPCTRPQRQTPYHMVVDREWGCTGTLAGVINEDARGHKLFACVKRPMASSSVANVKCVYFGGERDGSHQQVTAGGRKPKRWQMYSRLRRVGARVLCWHLGQQR